MRANVYFINLTDEMIAEINHPETGGWGTPAGKAYLSAKDGNIDDTNRHLFKHVAVVAHDDGNAADGNEFIWTMLQNLADPWDANEDYSSLVQVISNNERSMDVGDVIVWEDGRTECVASMGFAPSSFEVA